MTAVLNEPSQAVMRRLGLTEVARSDHPGIPAGHPLQPQVTYHRPRRARLVAPQTVPGQPGQTQPHRADRLGQDPAKRMQYRPGLLNGFLASTGLDHTPFCDPTIEVR
jgi:hypothetical protein